MNANVARKYHWLRYTKVSFFWDQSQDMSSSGFPPKKPSSDLMTYLVYQLKACFFWQEITWTHVLTRILEKTDFIKKYSNFPKEETLLFDSQWNYFFFNFYEKVFYRFCNANHWPPLGTRFDLEQCCQIYYFDGTNIKFCSFIPLCWFAFWCCMKYLYIYYQPRLFHSILYYSMILYCSLKWSAIILYYY